MLDLVVVDLIVDGVAGLVMIVILEFQLFQDEGVVGIDSRFETNGVSECHKIDQDEYTADEEGIPTAVWRACRLGSSCSCHDGGITHTKERERR